MSDLQLPLPAPALRRPGPIGRPGTRQLGRGRGTTMLELRHWLLLGGTLMTGVHLVLGRPEFSLPVRALLALPLLVLLWEVHRYASRRADEPELPVAMLGLFYYYMTFSFPALFHIDFFDLSGPVAFTDEARLLGALAISGGAGTLYLGARAGEWLGRKGRPTFVRFAPPPEVPPAFARSVIIYGVACLLTAQLVLLVTAVPQEVNMIVGATISFDVGIGMVLARAELFRGRWSRHFGTALFLAGGAAGLLRGMLDPVVRLGITFFAGRWAYSRRISVALMFGVLTVYLVFQPIKQDFRAQVWQRRGDEAASYSERFDAWGQAFSNFWSGSQSKDTSAEVTDSAISRVSELDSVNHAFMLLPGQVQPLEGAGWQSIFTSWIPRLVWADKPTTQSLEGRYAYVFHRQSEVGARSTAILLPLIVDGYWNFGWPGIFVACFMMGLWIGVIQKMFSGTHWAMQAMGVAHFSRLVVQGAMSTVYSGLFQQVAGLLLATWMVYGLAKLLSKERRMAARRVFGGPRHLPG